MMIDAKSSRLPMRAGREAIRFEAPLPPPGLRRNHETRNHRHRAALASEYSEAVWCAGQECKFAMSSIVIPRERTTDGSSLKAVVKCRGIPRGLEPWEKAHLRLVWKHAGVAPDEDNALASLKVLIDTLHTKGRRPLGIFLNDSPDCLTVELRTEKVAHRIDEGITVEIERV